MAAGCLTLALADLSNSGSECQQWKGFMLPVHYNFPRQFVTPESPFFIKFTDGKKMYPDLGFLSSSRLLFCPVNFNLDLLLRQQLLYGSSKDDILPYQYFVPHLTHLSQSIFSSLNVTSHFITCALILRKIKMEILSHYKYSA